MKNYIPDALADAGDVHITRNGFICTNCQEWFPHEDAADDVGKLWPGVCAHCAATSEDAW
jgi:hypothetical protein